MKKFLLSLAAVALATTPMMAEQVTDVLNITDFITDGSTTSYKNVTFTAPSGVTYGANLACAAKDYGSGFQLRGTNPSGIWVTENPNNLELVSVTITWVSKTADARQLDFYQKDSAYASGDLYASSSSTQGSSIGSLAKSSDQTVLTDLDTDIHYWGVRSKSSALYLGPEITVVYNKIDSDKKEAELSFNKTEFNVASTLKYFGDAYLSNPNNLTVTYSSSDTSVAEITANGVQINGVGTTVITATSEENDEYMAGKASYTLNVLNPVTSVAQMLALSTGDKILVNAELLVGFVNYSNIFVTDGEDWIQIYNANDYKKGDVIPAGWPATYTLYNGVTPELTDATLPVSTSNAATYLQYPVLGYPTTADVNKVAYFTITFDEATPADKSNFTGTIDGTSVDMRNNYTIESVEAGTYKVLAVVVVYNGKVQLYPVSYEDVTTAVELPSTIDITVNSSAATVSQSYDGDTYNITIKGQAEKGEDTIQVNLATPEGFDGFLLYSAEYGDITILTSTAAKAPAEWIPSSAFPGKKSNAFIATADNYEYEVQGCLYKGDEIASNGMLYFTVKVAKGETVGVNEVEEAAAEAEYYTLDGVKVANPANGIYVKVTGDKTEKVVIK